MSEELEQPPKKETPNYNGPGQPKRKWLRRLNERHREALERYFMGELVRHIARDLKMSKVYLWWVIQNPRAQEYLRQLQEARVKAFTDTQALISLKKSGALDTLLDRVNVIKDAPLSREDKLRRMVQNAQGKGNSPS